MKVAAIYRVSTDKQVRRDGEDTIPVQRGAVRAFIAERPGWMLVQEYAEEGVSGFKVSAEDRDVLQQALRDARAGRWQALVVFKADRLSRNSLEYPVVLDRFRRIGVAVWSVKDGAGGRLLALDSQMDKFIRFLEGWQAETESQNTSIRVSEAMLQMARQGRWTGGPVPYGFRPNPERRPRSDTPALAVDPEQAAVVRLMVRLYLDERMGCKLIATELNRRGIANPPTGKPWDDQRVRRILHNPIIAGLPAYNRTRPAGAGRTWKNPYRLEEFVVPRDAAGSLAPLPAYQIVPLAQWLRLQDAMRSGRPGRTASPGTGPVRYGVTARVRAAEGLLTGLVFCGHCGAALSVTSTRYRQVRRDGGVTITRRPYYICNTHLRRGKAYCAGQRTYGRKRLEQAVRRQLEHLLTLMDQTELAAMLETGVALGREQTAEQQRHLEAELRRAERALAGWLDRMDAHLGDPENSPYSEAILGARIRDARERCESLRQALDERVRRERHAAVTRDQVDEFVAIAPHWWACLTQADAQEQKLLIRDVVERIIVQRDDLEIRFRVDLAAFLPRARELAAGGLGEAPPRLAAGAAAAHAGEPRPAVLRCSWNLTGGTDPAWRPHT